MLMVLGFNNARRLKTLTTPKHGEGCVPSEELEDEERSQNRGGRFAKVGMPSPLGKKAKTFAEVAA